MPASTSAASAASSSGAGGSVADVALGVAHDADLGRDVEAELAAGAADELGRAAADVDHDQLGRVVRRARSRRSGVRERGLLVAAQRARLQRVAVAHDGGELGAVGGVADRRGHDRRARVALVLADRGRVALERGEHAPLRLVAEPPGRLDALAQPRHRRLPHALLDRGRTVHVRDQQAGRICAYVDYRRSHGRLRTL